MSIPFKELLEDMALQYVQKPQYLEVMYKVASFEWIMKAVMLL